MEQNQQSFLDIYKTFSSVHSHISDFLLAHLILTPKNHILHEISVEKEQAHYQPQVTTGKRQAHHPVVLAE